MTLNTSVACQNFSSRALEKKGHTFLDRDLSQWVEMGSKESFTRGVVFLEVPNHCFEFAHLDRFNTMSQFLKKTKKYLSRNIFFDEVYCFLISYVFTRYL